MFGKYSGVNLARRKLGRKQAPSRGTGSIAVNQLLCHGGSCSLEEGEGSQVVVQPKKPEWWSMGMLLPGPKNHQAHDLQSENVHLLLIA